MFLMTDFYPKIWTCFAPLIFYVFMFEYMMMTMPG